MKHKFLNKLLTATLTLALSISLLPLSNTAKANATTSTSTASNNGVPGKILVGYWHNFENGTGTIKLRDVSPDWDVVNLSFGEGTTVDSGDIKFVPFNATPEEFKADVKFLQSRGQKVLISIGGEKGQVQLKTTTAKNNFINSVSNIIDTYGLDGLDIDFEGHSLYFDAGDTDFNNPKTSVIVNLIDALTTLDNKYGEKFLLTMAPETFFVQNGYSFYGNNGTGADPRCGAYLPVINALRDRLDWLQVQYYNSGPIKDLNGKYQTMGSAEFYVALADMLLQGFNVAGNPNQFFKPLRPDQVVIGVPACVNAGNGFVSNAEVQKALDVLMNGGTVGSYTIKDGYPGLRGLMTWSINWDQYTKFVWSKYFRSYLDSIQPPVNKLKAATITASSVVNTSYSLNINIPAYNSATTYEVLENGKSIETKNITAGMSSVQTIKKDFASKAYGSYTYSVVLKDGNNTIASNNLTVEVLDPNEDPNKEDVNKDGKIDITDLSLVGAKYNTVVIAGSDDIKYDINRDGFVDLYDLTKISKKIGSGENPDNTEWKAGVTYKMGDKVTYKGKTYECTFAHTSMVTWEPGSAPALWKEI